MKIAILSRNFDVKGGGAERYACEVARHLAKHHEVHVFSQRFGDRLPEVFYHPLVFAIRRPRWLNQLGFALETWWRTRTGFDVIHSHENTWHGQVQTAHVLPVRSSLLMGRKSWQKCLQYLKIATSPRLISYLWLERRRFKKQPGRCIVAVSTSLAKNIELAYPESKSFIRIITPGVDLPDQSPAIVREYAREKLKLPADRWIALFVANDPRRKGLDSLFKAMALDGADWCLAVAGESAQYSFYQQKADDLKLGHRIFFLGSQKNLSSAYFAANALLHPTHEDTFAMVVLEAMAHQLPVMVSGAEYCGISHMLTHEKQALILEDPEDSARIHGFVQQLQNQPDLSNMLSFKGLEFAKQHAWHQVAKAYESVFEACVNDSIERGA